VHGEPTERTGRPHGQTGRIAAMAAVAMLGLANPGVGAPGDINARRNRPERVRAAKWRSAPAMRPGPHGRQRVPRCPGRAGRTWVRGRSRSPHPIEPPGEGKPGKRNGGKPNRAGLQKEGRKTMTHAFDGDDLFAPVSFGGGGGRDPDGGGRGYGGWSRNNCRRPRGLAEGGTALSAFDVNCNGNPWDDISLGASLVGGGVSVAARSAVSAVISGVGIGASFAGEHWSREN
jgi:hypothetical protein